MLNKMRRQNIILKWAWIWRLGTWVNGSSEWPQVPLLVRKQIFLETWTGYIFCPLFYLILQPSNHAHALLHSRHCGRSTDDLNTNKHESQFSNDLTIVCLMIVLYCCCFNRTIGISLKLYELIFIFERSFLFYQFL